MICSTRFYLGTHMPGWLARLDVPLFVSHVRLRSRVRLPVARTGWALDSGGFTELDKHGAWHTEPAEYIDACRRYLAEIGGLEWAAPMDWMCEPFMVRKTGLSVDRHQALTVENVLHLRQQAPDVPFIPVLQGWTIGDYVACAVRYYAAGHLASCDSLAWSYNARRHPPMSGCAHASCANCPRWALRWRERLLRRLSVQQLVLGEAA